VLEGIVCSEINKVITNYYDPEKIEIESNSVASKLDKLWKEKGILSAKLSENNRVIKLLYFDRAKNIITEDMFYETTQDLQRDNEILNKQISQIDTEIEQANQGLDDEYHKEKLISKYSQVDELTSDIVAEFIKAIYVGEFVDKDTLREVKIIWNWAA